MWLYIYSKAYVQKFWLHKNSKKHLYVAVYMFNVEHYFNKFHFVEAIVLMLVSKVQKCRIIRKILGALELVQNKSSISNMYLKLQTPASKK